MASKKKTETAVNTGTTVAVLPDLSELLPPPSAVLGTTVDADPSRVDGEIPDGAYIVTVRYDHHSPPELVASRGVTVIEFDTDEFNPWYLDSETEIDEAEDKIQQAIALLEAADFSDDTETAIMELDLTLRTFPEIREDLRREQEETEADDLD